MKKYLKWAAVLIWMIIIFIFSSQNGDTSKDSSNIIVNFVSYLGVDVKGNAIETASFIVRKTAHITEYFILYMLIFNALMEDFKIKSSITLAFIFTVLYSITDEIHQLYVPGRTGMIRDVLIDSIGSAVGILLLVIINRRKLSQ